MNELKIFEGHNVGIIVENGEPLFEIYSTGTALGHADIKFLQAGEKHYPRKDRIVTLHNSDVLSKDTRKLNNAGENSSATWQSH